MNLHIPQPCPENWENMTPNQQGHFCQVCSKTVVDFTQMTDDEVLNYFARHQGQNVCGKLLKTQLAQTEVEIIIPQSVLKRGLKTWQVFGLSLLLVFGVVLTGFTGTHHTKANFILEQQYSALKIDTPPPIPHIIGDIQPEYLQEENVLGMIINEHKPPTYKGGELARQQYLKEKLSKIDFSSYADSLPRKVITEFFIDTAGRSQKIKIHKGGLDSAFNQQIINIVEQMPDWQPGRLFDKSEIVKMYMPIKILTKE